MRKHMPGCGCCGDLCEEVEGLIFRKSFTNLPDEEVAVPYDEDGIVAFRQESSPEIVTVNFGSNAYGYRRFTKGGVIKAEQLFSREYIYEYEFEWFNREDFYTQKPFNLHSYRLNTICKVKTKLTINETRRYWTARIPGEIIFYWDAVYAEKDCGTFDGFVARYPSYGEIVTDNTFSDSYVFEANDWQSGGVFSTSSTDIVQHSPYFTSLDCEVGAKKNKSITPHFHPGQTSIGQVTNKGVLLFQDLGGMAADLNNISGSSNPSPFHSNEPMYPNGYSGSGSNLAGVARWPIPDTSTTTTPAHPYTIDFVVKIRKFVAEAFNVERPASNFVVYADEEKVCSQTSVELFDETCNLTKIEFEFYG